MCLDEHFDNFTEGSEDAISTTSLLDDMGNFTDPSKLSAYDGECYVEVKAWGTPGDWLDIHGGSEVCSNAIEFPEEGFVTRRVALPMCSSKEKFYFYSNNGYPFLIDYIRITQPIKSARHRPSPRHPRSWRTARHAPPTRPTWHSATTAPRHIP